MLWCFLVALAGGLVGLVLGNLRLPPRSSSPRAAAGAGANLLISAVAAATASIAHIRAGRINWRLFAWMAPPSVVGALLGGYLSGVLPQRRAARRIAAVLLYSCLRPLALDAAAAAAPTRHAARPRHPRAAVAPARSSGCSAASSG